MSVFEEFATLLFGKEEMAKRLPRPVYLKWKDAFNNESALDRETADAIAHAMKVWAIEKGATHFSHLFQPLNGLTAEKHDSFVNRIDSHFLLSFSGTELIKGETDGSSFPTGGLRATFEARGYTYWDITSYAFVRGHVLYIPSIFVSYRGEKLDMKAPLLAAINSLSDKSSAILRLLGKPVKSVKPMVGLEQEYFLVDTKFYQNRPDLIYTGRTLIGDTTPKGQEFEDHYFGVIDERINNFMQEVNEECWKLGIYLKVEHNEVAPGQFECCSIYEHASIAIDQNLLVMDILKKSARHHGFTCLLHEKPFAGVNGSGKHNNFSLESNTGHNLFDSGKTHEDHVIFLLFLSAFVASVDKYPTLIRLACSDAGNDFRLGADEAPPAIISVFLGDELEETINHIKDNPDLSDLKLSAHTYSPLKNIGEIPFENTDRNRTSPITFTGNKFEIRMLGSSLSPAMLNVVLYSGLADELEPILNRLEKVEDPYQEALVIVSELIKKHERVLFNGDGYSEEWIVEAKRRGLPNVASYVETIDTLGQKEVVLMLERQGVLSQRELFSRQAILREQFNHTIHTEVLTLSSMVRKQVIPSLMKYIREVMRTDIALDAKSRFLIRQKEELANLLDNLDDATSRMEAECEAIFTGEHSPQTGVDLQYRVKPLMSEVRMYCDRVERSIASMHYPFPTYTDLLFTR